MAEPTVVFGFRSLGEYAAMLRARGFHVTSGPGQSAHSWHYPGQLVLTAAGRRKLCLLLDRRPGLGWIEREQLDWAPAGERATYEQTSAEEASAITLRVLAQHAILRRLEVR